MPPKPTPQITSTALPSSLSTNIHHLTRTLSTATGLDAFLATAFEGGRHAARVDKLSQEMPA